MGVYKFISVNACLIMPIRLDRYEIFLDLAHTGQTYTGNETISGVFEGDNLEIDAKEIEIESVEVDGKEREFRLDTEKWKLEVYRMMGGPFSIRIKFRGKINDGIHGLHLGGKGDGEMLSSDLAPFSAREFFPCLDNPSIKAVFSISLRIDPDLDAISNMPMIVEKRSEEFKEVKFQDSPRMATYLLFVGVGRFSTRKKRYGNVDVILATPGSGIRSDDFPLDTAIKCLAFYENYFGIEYPLPKLHLVAVPELAWGAMENWGSITFRESALLTNESSDAQSRIWIATTVAHEIAHQWFGNLVTMKWWNDIWLNESFATFLSYLCIDSIFPEEEIWKTMYQSETLWAMGEDCLRHSHPIDVKVSDPDEIQQIFDGISYGKGASILRMLEGYLGPANFRNGVRQYLADFMYSNAEGKDFWEHMERASGLPVVRIAGAWIGMQGFPFISVTDDSGRIMLEQQRFLLDGTATGELWPIPVIVRRTTGDERLLMETREVEISPEGLIKINSQGSGFFIVSYRPNYIEFIRPKLKDFSDIDLAEAANDVFMLFMRGNISLTDYFETINALTVRPASPAINIISSQIGTLSLVLGKNGEFVQGSVGFMRRILGLIGERREGEKKIVSAARNSVMEMLALLDTDFAGKYSGMFDQFFDLDPNLRSTVSISFSHFANGMEKYRRFLEKSGDDSDRRKLIAGMGLLKGRENHEELYDMISRGEIKKQESISVLDALLKNEDAHEFLLERFESIISSIRKFFSGTVGPSFAVQDAVPVLGLENAGKAVALLRKINAPDISMGVSKAHETLEIYLRVRKRPGVKI